jgi:hypothetical protein
MQTAFIRRGPWGYLWERHPDMAAVADWRMTTLAELPGIVAEVNRSARLKHAWRHGRCAERLS